MKLYVLLIAMFLMTSCATSPQNLAASQNDAFKLREPLAGELERIAPIFAIGSHYKSGDIKIFFGSYEAYSSKKNSKDMEGAYNFTPVIVVKKFGQKPRIASFPKYKHYGWVNATYLASKNSYWAVLDYMVEGNLKVIDILWSQDDGETWSKYSTFEKERFDLSFKSMDLKEDGSGIAVVWDGVSHYFHRTKDLGKTWARAEIYDSTQAMGFSSSEECFWNMYSTKNLKKECLLPSEVFENQ